MSSDRHCSGRAVYSISWRNATGVVAEAYVIYPVEPGRGTKSSEAGRSTRSVHNVSWRKIRAVLRGSGAKVHRHTCIMLQCELKCGLQYYRLKSLDLVDLD